jgi:hypothetical protein
LLVNCSRSREAVDRRLEGDVKASVDTAHGNLTALSFGVPHIVINNPLRAAKVEGYVRLAGLDEFRITDWAALEETFDRLGATPRERWATTADRLKARVCEQFDRLTELIARAAEEHRETRDRPAKSRGELPLELYSTIAELHARLEHEKTARQATEKELRDSKKFLRDRHLAHKARLKRSEDRNECLEADVRTLRAQNECLEERLRGITL